MDLYKLPEYKYAENFQAQCSSQHRSTRGITQHIAHQFPFSNEHEHRQKRRNRTNGPRTHSVLPG